ncbi:polysaccharide deacetylase family protein [Streptomyces sp. S6]
MHWRIKGVAAACALLVAGLATGCTSESSATSRPTASPSGSGSASGAARAANPRAAVEAAYRKWGLKPLAEAPAPPATKPVELKAGGRIPVLSEIPTKEKIVFLTFDDGTEQDPQFVKMVQELKLPITMFLTNAAIRNDYGYFQKLQALGNPVENHTLTHPNLPTLSGVAQQQEICGQQTKLKEHYGTAPRLFRPPYGNWNEATRTAAASCGLQAIVLWRESMQIQNMQYQLPGKKLRPGEIILAHFRGPSELKGRTITQMTVNMLRHIEEQGYTVARLEDYL